MDNPLFSQHVSGQPCEDGVHQSQIEGSTSKKPRSANTTSELGNPVTRDDVRASSMPKAEPCWNFLSRGQCSYGENCIFAHVYKDRIRTPFNDQKFGGGGRNMERNWNVVNENKRGVCRFFLSGRGCSYGKSCIFRHPQPNNFEEFQNMPLESSVINIPRADIDPKTNPQFKTKLCNRWMTLNSCMYGAKCTYAHGEAELTRSSASLGSEFGNTQIAPRAWKEDGVPYAAGAQVNEQKVPQKLSLLNKRRVNKIVGIYGDWIDERFPPACSATTQEK